MLNPSFSLYILLINNFIYFLQHEATNRFILGWPTEINLQTIFKLWNILNPHLGRVFLLTSMDGNGAYKYVSFWK